MANPGVFTKRGRTKEGSHSGTESVRSISQLTLLSHERSCASRVQGCYFLLARVNRTLLLLFVYT